MSIQFNFFADNNDRVIVADELMRFLPSAVAYQSRGVIAPTYISAPNDILTLANDKVWVICDANNVRSISIFRIDESTSIIRVSENPVIEYCPSYEMGYGEVRAGRLYVSFGGDEFIRMTRRLFKSLKTKGQRLGKTDMWIFPSAALTAKKLRPVVGLNFENPYLP